MPIELVERDGSVRLRVRVKPRAPRNRVLGIKGDALEVAVAAAPVEGAANRALLDALAEHFELPRRSVALVTGEHGRSKLVALAGTTAATVRARLIGPAPAHRGR